MKRVNYRDMVALTRQEQEQMNRYVQRCLLKVSGRMPEEIIEIKEQDELPTMQSNQA